jgi:hypothetical protein
MQHLDRNMTIQKWLVSLIDDAESPHAKFLLDAV